MDASEKEVEVGKFVREYRGKTVRQMAEELACFRDAMLVEFAARMAAAIQAAREQGQGELLESRGLWQFASGLKGLGQDLSKATVRLGPAEGQIAVDAAGALHVERITVERAEGQSDEQLRETVRRLAGESAQLCADTVTVAQVLRERKLAPELAGQLRDGVLTELIADAKRMIALVESIALPEAEELAFEEAEEQDAEEDWHDERKGDAG